MKLLICIFSFAILTSCNDKKTDPQVNNSSIERAHLIGQIANVKVDVLSNDSTTFDLNTEMINVLEGGTQGTPVLYFYQNYNSKVTASAFEIYRILSNNFSAKDDWRKFTVAEKFANLKATFQPNSDNWQIYLEKRKYLSNTAVKLTEAHEISVPVGYNGSVYSKGLYTTFNIKGFCKNTDQPTDSIYVDLTLKARVLVNNEWQTSFQLPR